MRPQIILIALIGIIFTIVDARSYYTYLNNRPVIDLNKKPAPTTPKSTLERSATFPKGHLKVMDLPTKSSKYSKVGKLSQNPFVKNINKNDNPKVQGLKVTENVRSKLTELTPKITENRMPKSEIIDSKFLNKTTAELEYVARYHPTVDGLVNNSNVRKTVSNDNLSNGKVHKEIDEDEYSVSTAKKRQVRSVNIIEEENLATTMAGFKFTGREPRLLSHQGFKNIHS